MLSNRVICFFVMILSRYKKIMNENSTGQILLISSELKNNADTNANVAELLSKRSELINLFYWQLNQDTQIVH